MSNKEKYKLHCQTEKTIPIFSQPWWLDTMCGENRWDVVIVENNGEIVASIPYLVRKRYGYTILTQPPLTQFLGPWLRESTGKPCKVLAVQKSLMNQLIDKLPDCAKYGQNWSLDIQNWLPFYWKGFKQTTRYTYVLSGLQNEADLWAGVESRIRREVRKAKNRFNLKVKCSEDIEALLELNRMTFARQGLLPGNSRHLVRKLDKVCKERECRKIWIAEDDEGRHHAGVYIVWDKSSAYYLMGGGNSELRTSGATSLVMWEAIKHARSVVNKFDFEGSMIEPIERFFRGFGAEQKPYHNVTKINSKSLNFILTLLSLIKVENHLMFPAIDLQR